MSHRLPLLLACAALSVAILCAPGAAPASAAGSHRPPVRRALPAIGGTAQAGRLLRARPGRWRGARTFAYRWERCDTHGRHCHLIDAARRRRPYTGRGYRLTVRDVGHRLRVIVIARNAWGRRAATSRPTRVVARAGSVGGGGGGGAPGHPGAPAGTGAPPTPGSPAPPPPAPPGPPPVTHFSTVASSETGSPPAGIPRPDATCAAEVRPAAENRPDNVTANHTVPSNPSSISWGAPGLNSGFPKYAADTRYVTGNYTGTTDEILQWVACKWGIDEDIVRADAYVESRWHQDVVGDVCGPAGEASYGILQVKNEDCSGAPVHGGYPYTQHDTALDADYWGARLRACLDGAFYNGGDWLYGGKTISYWIAGHGEDYAVWGCIGSWFSGQWYDSGAQSYIANVQNVYASKPWLQPGF